MTQVICPKCGKPAAESSTRYGQRHDCCGLRSWGGKPLAAPETHEARQRAHAAFDPLWKGKGRVLSRAQAYKRLAEELGIARRDCHISLMDEATASRVPNAAQRIRARARLGKSSVDALDKLREAMS